VRVPLYGIASGPGAFGPRGEWRDWYHYLPGRLIARSHESFVSALLQIHIIDDDA
jgi:hypothetical protein